MPLFRPEIEALRPYQVGRQLADVARVHGLRPDDIVKLTANEGPEGPFPGVIEAATAVLADSNRYPDNDCWELGQALAEQEGIGFENILFGAGSVALLAELAIAALGPGTNMVYGWPSFVLYRFAGIWAGAENREIPLDDRFALDLDSMRVAIDDRTRVVIVCNPNNPTGTITSADQIDEFIDSVPDDVLVVIDEAYHEFVVDPAYRTQVRQAVTRPNVVVLRTFSKIYALAAHRIGYAISQPEVLTELRKAQAPLTVNQVAQAAALASLGQQAELARRRDDNARRRHHLVGALRERGLPMADSHTNFIFFEVGDRYLEIVESMTSHGVLIRPMTPGWVRVTIGDDEENRRFLDALDSSLT